MIKVTFNLAVTTGVFLFSPTVVADVPAIPRVGDFVSFYFVSPESVQVSESDSFNKDDLVGPYSEIGWQVSKVTFVIGGDENGFSDGTCVNIDLLPVTS